MITQFKKILDFILVISILTTSILTGGKKDNDIEKISQNITQGILSGNLDLMTGSDLKTADEIISHIEPDYSGYHFDDVDYTDETRSGWKTVRHLGRTLRLTALWKTQSNQEIKDAYLKYIYGLLDHWIENDYQNSNWWYNKLANPNTLGDIGVLLGDELKGKRLLGLAELVSRGCFTVNHQVRKHEGANAVDIAMSSIKFGVIMKSRLAIKDAVKVVEKALEYSNGQGLRADKTFFQHGERLYMGGYGVTFISGMANLITMLDSTKYNFDNDKLSNLSDFIVDGLKTMSFGDTLDPTTMGRSVSRKGAQPLKSVVKALTMLSKASDFPRSEEIKKYITSIINDDTSDDIGLRWFDEAKFLVINKKDFYFSFRGGADYLAYSEIINDENVLSYNSSFPGVTTIMHTGDEYTDIVPIFDYSLVPGTTAVYETDEELLAHEDFTYRYLEGIYPEKVENSAAICSAQTTHEGIGMTVTCFATENAAFLLGAGMKDSQNRPMNTTINQCRYAGEYIQNENEVIHNGIKYTLINGGKLHVQNQHITGNYHRNNLPSDLTAVEGDVFALFFENSGEYAYSIMAENTDENIEIIINTDKVQAVKMPNGKIAAAFFADTSFVYNNKTYYGIGGQAYFF